MWLATANQNSLFLRSVAMQQFVYNIASFDVKLLQKNYALVKVNGAEII